MAEKHPDDAAREAEARRTLDRVAQDSEVIGQSTFVRTAERVRSHMRADEADETDPVEIWGRRTGRAISVIAFVLLAVWLARYLMR